MALCAIPDELVIRTNHLKAGFEVHYPTLVLTEAEIISFAEQFDPQPLHTDPAFAAQTPFKRIIASGLHGYIEHHRKHWVPGVQQHFVCGLGFDEVRFVRPLYPDYPFACHLQIRQVDPKPDRNRQAVHWQFNLVNPTDGIICWLQLSTYHLLEA
jgi:acyl dehydratase